MLATLAVVLFALSLHAQEPPEFEPNEEGCLDARVLDYLDRHGDYGTIDPEALLYVTRLEHERRTALHTSAISGNAWNSIGPTNGAGRGTALALHPAVPGTAIIGASGGGAWRTFDRGENWTPLTETIPNLSVGAIAYAPSDPSIVYLGTGEGGSAFDFIPGIGLLVSHDGGSSWTLPSTVLATQFYRIAVHPTNPNDIIVGTNKGAMRSTSGPDGPWTSVIAQFPGFTPGYSDVTEVVRDPSNAAVLYAATWDRNRWCVRNTCSVGTTVSGPTILKSTNGGATWSPAATGLPQSTTNTRVERFSLAIAPSSPSTLYALTALFNADTGVTTSEVYKTVDGGGSWTKTQLSASTDTRVSNLLSTQGWYDNTLVVSPVDANLVVAGGVQYARTLNGGTTWHFPFTSGVPHVDVHELRYDPSGMLWIANDGGIWTSNDNATTSTNRTTGLVTRQYYALAMDRVNRNRILGGTQDNGTNLRAQAGGTSWSNFSGGDGFQCFIHPDAPGVAFSTFQFAAINRTTSASNPTPLLAPFGPSFLGSETKPFFSVLKAEPGNGTVIYTGTTRLWKSVTAGESWVPLSTNVTGDGTWSESTIRSIAISAGSQRIVVSKGTQIYRSTDGGASWTAINNGLPNRTVTNIEISPFDRETMYATIAGTTGPSLFATSNGGTTWEARANGLPAFSAQVVRVDPTDASTLYVGTDVGVYRSTDGGASFSQFGSGMPAVSVYDIQILADGSILRAATHGRGMWELAVTDVSNNPPVVSVSAPVSQFVARGSTLTLKGTATDPNGDPMSVKWTFPDDWSSAPGVSGATSAAHTFDRAGRWPVALTATDSHGATGGAETTIVVTEANDDCSTPLVVPSAGPFPWSVTLNSESASPQFGLEPSPGGSCYQFQPQRTMWLSFTPEVSGTYAFSLCTSRVAGFIAAYTGPACGSQVHVPLPMCVADSTLGSCSSDPVSTIDLVAGVEVRLYVGAFFSNSFGQQTVTINRGTTVELAVRAVSPARSSISGGIDVVITGDGFASGATVRFGGTPATNVNVISPTLISATVPAHSAGTVDVVVQTTKGTLTASRAFTYAAPPSSPRRRATGH